MNKGFSLIEVTVSLLILSFIVAGIYGVLYVGQSAFHTDMGQLLLQQQTRQGAYWMTKELREASAAGITITTVTQDVDDQITFSTIGQTGIKYYRDIDDVNNNEEIGEIIREDPDLPVDDEDKYKILAGNISGLTFALVENNKFVTIGLKAQRNVPGRQLEFEQQSKVLLRN